MQRGFLLKTLRKEVLICECIQYKENNKMFVFNLCELVYPIIRNDKGRYNKLHLNKDFENDLKG